MKDSEDESSEVESLRLIDSSEEEKEADSDSLKDFIVEDEKQKEGEEEEAEGETGDKSFRSHLPRQCKISVKFNLWEVKRKRVCMFGYLFVLLMMEYVQT